MTEQDPRQGTRPERRETLLAAAGFAVLTALAFPGLALWRGAPAYHDLSTHHIPWRFWTANQWLSGELPLWNPLCANGFPMLAEPQTGALYPPNLLFGLIDPFAALNLSILAHAWFAGMTAFLFARSLGFGRAGAGLTGLAYGSSGFLVTHVVYLPMLHAMVWIPVLMLAIDRYVRDGRPRAALAASGAAAMMVLAGHPQVAVLGALFGGSYLITRLLAGYVGGPPRPQRLSRGWKLGLALGFAGLLVLPQLVATLELAGESERAGGVEQAFAAQGALPPQEIVNAVLPRAFGYERPLDLPIAHHHHGELYWGNGETYWENVFFVGVPALLLALLGMTTGARGYRFFVAWFFVAPLLMVGPATPLYALWRLLPGADLLRFPARFSLLWTFSVAVLAGYGLDAWIAQARDATRRYRLTTRGLVALLIVAWAGAGALHLVVVRGEEGLVDKLEGYYEHKLATWREMAANPPPGVDPNELPPAPEGGEAPITVATLYDGDDYYGHKVRRILAEAKANTNPFGPRVVLPLGMVLAVLAMIPLAVRRPAFRWAIVGLAAMDLIAFVSGFMAPVPWETARAEPETVPVLKREAADGEFVRAAVVDRLAPLHLAAEMVGASDNVLFGIAEVSIPSPLRIQSQYSLVLDAGLGLEPIKPADRIERVARRIGAIQALGVTHLQTAHELPSPFELLWEGSVRVYRVPSSWPRASLHRGPVTDPEGVAAAGGAARELPVRVDEPGRIEIDVSGRGGGSVVVTETAYGGWKVAVDGQPADRAEAGGLLAVAVPPSAQSVTFEYRPGALLASLAIFPLMWVLWLVWFILAGRSRRESSFRRL